MLSKANVKRLVRRQWSTRIEAGTPFRDSKAMSADILDEVRTLFHFQRHAEQAAGQLRIVAARVVENVDRRAVLLGDFPHDRQAESAAFGLIAEDAVEPLEHMVALGMRNTR